MVARALLVVALAAGAARADGFVLPAVQQGCGPGGQITPELARLKLKGAANLAPCKPGSIVFVEARAKGKVVIGFAAKGAGWQVGRVYVAGTPSDDAAALSKLLPKKLSAQEAAAVLTAALLLSKGLHYAQAAFTADPPRVTAVMYAGPDCGPASRLTAKLAGGTVTLETSGAPAGPPCK